MAKAGSTGARKPIGAALCLVCFAATAQAQNRGEIASLGCQNDVVRQVRAQQTDVDSVRFTPDPLVMRKSRRQMSVLGDGRYQGRATRDWRPFQYECVYRPHSAKTQIILKFDTTTTRR